MVERGICPKSLVSRANGCRELSRFPAVCLCVLVSSGFDGFESQLMRCVPVPFMGRPPFPFIGQGKTRVTVEGKEENEKEKKSSRIVGSFFSYAGPADPVDVNRDSSTSRPCPSLAPCAGIASRSWRSTLFWRMSW